MRKQLVRRLHALALGLALFAPLTIHAPPARAGERPESVREIEIVVDGAYRPARIRVAQGERVRLRFVRKDWNGCTRELLIPALSLRRALPPGKPVIVDLPALAPGEYEFRCGMNMIRGTITVAAG
jgi:plastocyanin domain-containing protein